MTEELILLPTPRQIAWQEGVFALPEGQLIAIDAADAAALAFTAGRLQQALREQAAVAWEVVAGTAVPHNQVGVTLSVAPRVTLHHQGYSLTVTSQGIHVVAGTAAGVFYGVMTLVQLLGHYGRELPAVRIDDWPDYPHRGVMLDISRDKVPTMETLFELVDLLASWKVNQVQLYTEHTFAYRNHPEVWAEASPMTGAEILALDAFCRERFVELVPNQNTFGHMHHWLEHERYLPLAEAPDGADTPWGFRREGPFSLAPTLPGSLELVRGLLDELLPHFSSSQVNVGCDETYDVGQGKSKAAVEKHGVGRVYLDFLLKIYREVKARGRTMQFWGDIIVHHPELVAELPRDVIALEWGYEADHPFDDHGAIFADSGVPFYVCPGTSSWNTVAGRTDNALGNLGNAAENGRKHGAIGYLITDWGDRGHWQPLPVSYLGFAYGVAVSWADKANRAIDIAGATGRYAFRDKAGVMGRLAYDLGNAYHKAGVITFNSTIFFALLQLAPDKLEQMQSFIKEGSLDLEKLKQAGAHVETLMARLLEADMARPDADMVKREFTWAAGMLRHACRRGAWMLARQQGEHDDAMAEALTEEADSLIAEYKQIWLARNRPGGLRESVGRLEEMRSQYQQ